MNLEDLYSIFLEFPSVCTDTRKIKENDLFFALKGENFDGNTYAQKALINGASYAIIDNEDYRINEKTILVNDVLQTLQELANFHRRKSRAQIIGLTGSNGKTTTKELINAVLSKKYNTIATKGNLNNHIGVPLTLLSIAPKTEIAIIEMGANHQKEIEFLSKIAAPDFGYITNFGKAHLEGFGGVEGVIKGKSELFEYLIKNDRYIFMNADDPIQLQKSGSYIKKYGFSQTNNSFYKIELVSANPFVSMKVDSITINSQLIGAYNFPNCCAAILIGKYFNVSLETIKETIENYVPDNNRSQIMEKNSYKIILDAYNANPSSMKAALENFAKMNDDIKYLILGDMFELGTSAAEEHQAITTLCADLGFKNLFLVGENFYKTKTEFQKFKSFDSFRNFLKNMTIPKNSTLLIKGSRGMALERSLDLL